MEPSPLPRFVLRRRVGRLRLLPSCSVCIAMSPFLAIGRDPTLPTSTSWTLLRGAEEGDATYTSSYCECGRQAPEGAQRSEARAEWSTRAAGCRPTAGAVCPH